MIETGVRDNIEAFGGDPNQGVLIILTRHLACNRRA